MASGSFGVSTSNGYISGSVTWQEQNTNTTNNTSDVYVEMRLSRTNTGYTTTGSGTFTVTVNGTNVSNSPSFSLTYNSNTLMVSGTVTVPHNSDGTKAITISWSGSSNVFTVNSGSGTATLSTIPRASTISSSVSWTAGTQNLPVTLNVADSSFHHTLTVQVINGAGTAHNICTRTNIGSSTTIVFTQSENTDLYTWLAQNSSITVKLYCDTYDSSNNTIGSQTNQSGTCYSATPSTPTMSDFNIGDTVTINLSPPSSSFTQTVTFSFGSYNPTIASGTTATSISWNTSANDSGTGTSYANGLYQQIPNSASGWGRAVVTTYYNGQQVQNPQQTGQVNAYVVNSNPTFGTGYSYTDTNSTTSAITGDASYIIQNNSTVQVTLPTTAFATAQHYATMSSYSFTLNGVTKTATQGGSNIVLSFGTVNASTNQTLTVKAIDSRGLSTTTSMTVKMIPYQAPIVTATAKRLNGFENEIDITLSGSISALTVGGVQKNALTSISGEPAPLEYCYAENVTGSTFSAWTAFTYTTSGATYTATSTSVSLDNTKSYVFQIRATDKLQTSTQSYIVASGSPVLFMDFDLNSVGIGKFPTGTNTLETLGDAIVGGNLQVNNKPFVTELTASIPATANWYRVATSASGVANCMAEFEILAPLSSHHSTSKVIASINYANASYVGYTSLNQINHSVYNTNSSGAVTQVRIVYNTSYSGNYAYLEVYCPNASSFNLTVRMIGGTGWSLVTPNTVGSIPTGYTSLPITLQAGGTVTSGKVYENGSPVAPVGQITMFGGSTAPTGYLLCQGQAVSRTTYSALYSAIGTTYGTGDGSTTFNLPNLQSRVPVGYNSGDTNFNALGKTGGEATHALTTAEMPAHSHSNTPNYVNAQGSGTSISVASGTAYGFGYNATYSTDTQGSGTAHNNLQPYIALNFIIKI